MNANDEWDDCEGWYAENGEWDGQDYNDEDQQEAARPRELGAKAASSSKSMVD